MTELPRSRALVRLDGSGHIMPIEPVTPPDSAVWRVIHFPIMLIVVAIGLLAVAALAIKLLGFGFQFFTYVPGARYLAPLIAAAAVVAVYCVFVRVVERRRDIVELGADGWLKEAGLGFCAGLGWSLAIFAILRLLDAVRIVGFNPPGVMLLPFVVQLCTAICLEIILRGLFFRLVERLLGSWLTLVLGALALGGAPLVDRTLAPAAVLAAVLQGGLMFAAAYMVTRRLWAAIGLHAAWNVAQIGLYGVTTLDGESRGFVLSRVVGPDGLTGGRAGTDASIPALIVTALVVVALLTVAARRGRIVRPIWRRGRTA